MDGEFMYILLLDETMKLKEILSSLGSHKGIRDMLELSCIS